MNFLDLYKKIQSLDQPVPESQEMHHYHNGGVEEDGVEMGASATAPSAPQMGDGQAALPEMDFGNDGAGMQSPVGSNDPGAEEIAEPTVAPNHTDHMPVIQGEEEEEESIMMMPAMDMPHEPTAQPDSVSMNVSMNGSGPGGIKDLMAVLRNIENGTSEPQHHKPANDVVLGDPVGGDEHLPVAEKFGNSVHGDAGPHTMGLDAAIHGGNDLHSQDAAEPVKKQGGGNPYHESLVNKLSAMYQQIKEERTEEKDEHGNVVRWKEESDWKKAEKKDGRGKVTNMSDKARRESEKMSKKDVKENAHHEDDEERKIRHLMRKYGWSHQEALEYYHYEQHDPKDYEDMEESQLYENDLEKALDSTAGGFTGWNHMQGKSYENYGPYKHHVRTAVKNGADVYHYDDGEGGYDATGEVVYDKNNGIYYAVINKEPSTHKSLGSLMNLIRNEIGENGRRHDANNQHRSDSLDREPFDPEQHLYKTDRAGKKGMLNKGRINDLTSPYRRKITGPQSVLPEQMNESKELNDIIALTKYLKG